MLGRARCWKTTSVTTVKQIARLPICLMFLLSVFACTRPSTKNSPDIAKQTSTTPLIVRALDSPTSGDSREPELTTTPDGRILLSWVERISEKSYALKMSTRNGSGWGQTQTVAQGDNWFVNWADFPSVIGLSDGSFAAHWLVKSGTASYAYNVNISQSKDQGVTWSKPIVPHSDNTQTEHGFVSLLPLRDGRVGAVWVDGRNMKGMKEDHDEDMPLPVSMILRYAAIDSAGKISEETVLDDRICECCQTSAAITNAGVVAVYRDRSQDEVRDIYSVRQDGGSWTKPQTVHADNWKINGCPVNGPSVSAQGNNVVVGWYTESGGTAHVNVAFDTNGGSTFGKAIQVDEGQTQGRVDVVLLSDNSALVCWLSGDAQSGSINVRRVEANGALGPKSEIARTDIARSSGFPRIARLGNEVYFAWTEFGKPSRIKTAVVDVSMFQ